MIIIYHCYGGAHSSVLSAAIHCNILPDKRMPENKEIASIPFFDKTESKDIGKLFYYGEDEKKNKVFIQGMGKSDKIVLRLLKELFIYYNIPEEEVILVDTLKNVNLLVRIGGFLSRRLGFIFPGRIFTIIGLKKSYDKFLQTVSEVKRKL
ncbi:DUF3189 family protein [Natronospora cellulosivora (SeqCode)]